MSSPINYLSPQYSAFSSGKASLQNKSRTNQVFEVIPICQQIDPWAKVILPTRIQAYEIR